MFKTVLVFIYALPLLVNGQVNMKKIDALKKYSYLIYGETKLKTFPATLFFIKYKGYTIALTASHVMTGYDPLSQQEIKPFPDTMYIEIYHKILHKKVGLPIPIVESKARVKHFDFHQIPDLWYDDFYLPKDSFQINSIEVYKPNTDKYFSNVKAFIVYGYPASQKNNVFKNGPFLKIDTNARKIVRAMDNINYEIITNTGSEGGYSGAPVFLLLNTGEIVFGGVLVGGDENLKNIDIIKPEIVFQQLDRLVNVINEGKKH